MCAEWNEQPSNIKPCILLMNGSAGCTAVYRANDWSWYISLWYIHLYLFMYIYIFTCEYLWANVYVDRDEYGIFIKGGAGIKY